MYIKLAAVFEIQLLFLKCFTLIVQKLCQINQQEWLWTLTVRNRAALAKKSVKNDSSCA